MKRNSRSTSWSMRLALLAAAMGLITTKPLAWAQVGYVNVVFTNGYSLVCNPLNVPPDNNLSDVIAAPPDGTRVWLWNIANQSFDTPSVYSSDPAGWSINLSVPPGRGFMVHSLENYTNTFLGEVLTGTLINPVPGSNQLALLGSKIPVDSALGLNLGFPGNDGDTVHTFSRSNQMYLDARVYLSGHGWFDPTGLAGTNGPNITVGEAFFIRHPGPDTNWVQVLVPFTAGSAPGVLGINVSDGRVTLHLRDKDRPYHVQFSPDRMAWTTIATNQTGGTWTGPLPAASAGFFQVVSP